MTDDKPISRSWNLRVGGLKLLLGGSIWIKAGDDTDKFECLFLWPHWLRPIGGYCLFDPRHWIDKWTDFYDPH